MVSLNDITVGYSNKIVVDDVNLEIKPGEIVTMIGANGSGKSTILKSVINQLPLINGNVMLDENDTSNMKPSDMAKYVSVIMTDRVKTELMTCREVVASGRYPYTNYMGILSKEDLKKVDEAIAKVDANEVADKDFMKISDGQRQRIMLARALAQEPKLMVLDEPTSYLDIKYKLSMMRTISDLAKNNNISIFMSLHELELAKLVSDRIVCIKDNRVDKIGNSEEIFADDYIKSLFDIADEDYLLWQRL